jgi:uncharacterized protein YaaR (DUF327 family)
MTLYELLFREWKDIQLLNDIVEKGFPVEIYKHYIKYKLNQLTKELQEENKKSIDTRNK